MDNKQVLHSSKINNLITKFYYKDNHLCFQILLNCDGNETKVYKEYTDYAEYRDEYDRLLQLKAKGDYILVNDNEVNATHLSFL